MFKHRPLLIWLLLGATALPRLATAKTRRERRLSAKRLEATGTES